MILPEDGPQLKALHAALQYAKFGWRVLPLYSANSDGLCTCGGPGCTSIAKHPRIHNWTKEASNDSETIKKWWRTWPDANVGIVTGEGWLVIDIDPRHGGDKSWAAIVAEYGLIEGALEVETGGGGKHIFIRYDTSVYPSLGNRSNLLPGIDVRALNGYVVAAPSIHASGNRYKWIDGKSPSDIKEVVQAPGWLLKLITPDAELQVSTANLTTGDVPAADRQRMALGAMLRLTTKDKNDGSMRLFQAACRAIEHGLDDDQAVRMIQQYAQACPFPRKWTDWDVRQRLADARKKAKSGSALEASNDGHNRSVADRLVDLATTNYTFGQDFDGEPFAIAKNGPNIALMFKNNGTSIKSALAREYRRKYRKTPNASTLSDALMVLHGEAMIKIPTHVHLRMAPYCNGIVVDLGDKSGQCVSITPDGWRLLDRSPVTFKRTKLTGELPIPHPDGDLAKLRELLNVCDYSWPLLVGWLIAAMIPDVPHAVAMLGGEQGTGKSTLARMCVGLVDPSPALLRSEPHDSEAWAVMAASSACLVIDNVSRIPAWFSDCLCKCVTGDGVVRRKLYTNSDVDVIAFKRPVMLTSIDPGALRGDLADRLVTINLEPISDGQRRTEAELEAAYCEAKPYLLGGLLNAVVLTLEALPSVRLRTMPRLADFAKVLAAVDFACPDLTGGQALSLFLRLRDTIAQDVIDGDPVATAIVNLLHRSADGWEGTVDALRLAITPSDQGNNPKPPRGWPTTPQAMAGRLRRLTPSFNHIGVHIDHDRESNRNRTRYVKLTLATTDCTEVDVQHVQNVQIPDKMDMLDVHEDEDKNVSATGRVGKAV